MAQSLQLECDQHADPFECPDVALVYNAVFDEYGVPIRDGGASYLLVSHCPWCGTRLPDSARDRWFAAVEAAGLGDGAPDRLPPEFLTSAWRLAPGT